MLGDQHTYHSHIPIFSLLFLYIYDRFPENKGEKNFGAQLVELSDLPV